MIFSAFFVCLQVSQLSVVGIFKILTAYAFNTTLPAGCQLSKYYNHSRVCILLWVRDEQMIAGSMISQRDNGLHPGTSPKFNVLILWDSFFNFSDLLSSGLSCLHLRYLAPWDGFVSLDFLPILCSDLEKGPHSLSLSLDLGFSLTICSDLGHLTETWAPSPAAYTPADPSW